MGRFAHHLNTILNVQKAFISLEQEMKLKIIKIGGRRMREPKEILINGKTLEKILENHKHWLNKDIDGWEYMRANLNSADLSNANLMYADLRYANSNNANLKGADLRDANLKYANLSDADLDKEEQIRKGVKLSNPITGWKKCKDGVIVKLEIPRGAIVFSINNDKCRTDKAIVKEIFGADRAFSMHKYFSYYVGDKIEVYNFNCEYNTECAEGIHFFRTRKEAENY